MSIERVKDCKGEDIHEDDYVATRYRGGTREGVVRTHRYDAVIIHTYMQREGVPPIVTYNAAMWFYFYDA
jgi:hypothetical protein